MAFLEVSTYNCTRRLLRGPARAIAIRRDTCSIILPAFLLESLSRFYVRGCAYQGRELSAQSQTAASPAPSAAPAPALDSRQAALLKDLKRRVAEDPHDYVSETSLIKLTLRLSRESGNIEALASSAQRLESIIQELGHYRTSYRPSLLGLYFPAPVFEGGEARAAGAELPPLGP